MDAPNLLQQIGGALQGGQAQQLVEQQMRDAQVAKLFSQNQGGDVRQLLQQAAAIDPAYARELIRLELANQGVGSNVPAALQLANEVARLEAAGDKAGADRIREFAKTAPITAEYSQGLFRLPDGSFAPISGYGAAKGSIAGDIKTAEDIAAANVKMGTTATEKAQKGQGVLDLIAKAEKILPKASSGVTGSIGAGLKGAVGISDEATQADKKLQVIAGALTSNVPRFEGPQGVLDVELYKQMAGDVANISKPREDRLAALQTMRELNQKYAPADGGNNSAQPKTPQAPIVRYNAQGQKATLINGQWVIE